MREYFLNQIYGEYQSYKASVLEENGGSIYARCYEIDCMINIYEILKEFAMKRSDSHYAEMEHHVADEMKKLISNTEELKERNVA